MTVGWISLPVRSAVRMSCAGGRTRAPELRPGIETGEKAGVRDNACQDLKASTSEVSQKPSYRPSSPPIAGEEGLVSRCKSSSQSIFSASDTPKMALCSQHFEAAICEGGYFAISTKQYSLVRVWRKMWPSTRAGVAAMASPVSLFSPGLSGNLRQAGNVKKQR